MPFIKANSTLPPKFNDSFPEKASEDRCYYRRDFQPETHQIPFGGRALPGPAEQCSRIRIFRFFQISKKHDFLRFLNDFEKT